MKGMKRLLGVLLLIALIGVPLSAQAAGGFDLMNHLNIEMGGTVSALVGMGESAAMFIPISVGFVALDLDYTGTGMRGILNPYVKYEPGFGYAMSNSSFGLLFAQSFAGGIDYYQRFANDFDFAVVAGLSAGLYQIFGGIASTSGPNIDFTGDYFGISPKIGVMFKNASYTISWHQMLGAVSSFVPSYISLCVTYRYGGSKIDGK